MYNADTFRKIHDFINPQQMLRGLLDTKVGQWNSNESKSKGPRFNSQQQLQEVIENLHAQLDNMNHQVIQAQSLLNQRDMLYNQLDYLRTERQQIQDQIESQQIRVENEVKIGKGVKQMNERLQRRIRSVEQYINKMSLQNKKIQQVLNGGQMNEQKFHSYTEYVSPSSPTWLQRVNQNQNNTVNNHKRFNFDYFTNIKKKIQTKETQAWNKVKKQQQEIYNRNALSHYGNRTGYAFQRRRDHY